MIRKSQAKAAGWGGASVGKSSSRMASTNPCRMFGRPDDRYRHLLDEVLEHLNPAELEDNISVTDGRNVITYRMRDGKWVRWAIYRNLAL